MRKRILIGTGISLGVIALGVCAYFLIQGFNVAKNFSEIYEILPVANHNLII